MSTPRNKLYNQSYFTMRLIKAGFNVLRLGIKFEPEDYRKWIVIINSSYTSVRDNICITCLRKSLSSPECSFMFCGKKGRAFTLQTKSMETIIDILKKTVD